MDTKNQQNNFNNPVVIILVLALIGLGGYILFSRTSNVSDNKVSDLPNLSNTQDTNTNTQSPVIEPKITPKVNQVAPTSQPSVPKTQTTNFELSTNPNYLLSKDFNQNKVKLYGVGIGDSTSSINPSSINHQQEYKLGLIRLLTGDAYMSSNGIVTGMYLRDSKVYGIYTENDIFTKFGWPDKSETTSDYYVGANHNTLKFYYYYSRGLQIMNSQNGPDTFISINIGS